LLNQKIVKSVLNKHKKRDNWFLDDYSVNPYEGCSCNCLYCYIRGSKYGENMAEHLFVKANITEVLEKQLQLRAKKNQYGFVAVGSATDAYMH
jgi:DNA repair photolyase